MGINVCDFRFLDWMISTCVGVFVYSMRPNDNRSFAARCDYKALNSAVLLIRLSIFWRISEYRDSIVTQVVLLPC